jgi:hypothetical protein
MAMKKTTPPPRPGGTGAPRNTSTALGSRKGTKVRKITKVTKPLTKSTVRNPDAPKGTGSGTSVKVITKNETFMKKDKARRDRTGMGRPQNASSFSKGKTVPSGPSATKYKSDRSKTADQTVRGTSARYGASFAELRKRDEMMRSAAGAKGSKPTKVTPKKKAAPAPAPASKQKRRIFAGRGGGMRGGVAGSLDSQIK